MNATSVCDKSNARVDKIQQRRDLAIDAQRYVHYFLAVWSISMAHVIVRGKTDRQHVGIVVLPELLVDDCLLGKREEQFVREWRVIESACKTLARASWRRR